MNDTTPKDSAGGDWLSAAIRIGETKRGLLAGPVGALDAYMEPAPGKGPGPIAVICHPNPRAGGTMGHKVCQTAAKAARERGLHALRFNYRGVGRSEGVHGNSGEEADDVRAILDHAATIAAGGRIILMGFSFGTWVGLPVGESDGRVERVIAIGMPLDARDFPYAEGVGRKPLFVVQGDADEFGAKETVLHWVDRRPGPTHVSFIPSGHFFHGRLKELEQAIVLAIDAPLG